MSDEVAAARAGNPMPYIELQWGSSVILDQWQRDYLMHLFDPAIAEVFLKGNTGCGKGAVTAIGICVFVSVFSDAKVIITRDNHPNAVKVAFGEVDKWWRRMDSPPVGARLLSEGIKFVGNSQRFVYVANPESDEGFHGQHSDHVFMWFDEATAPPLEERYKAAWTQATIFVATANPRTLAGNFREAFDSNDPDTTRVITTERGLRACMTVSGNQCRNVIEERLRNPVAPIGGITIDGRNFRRGERIPEEYFRRRRPIIPGQTCYDEWVGLANSPDEFVRDVFAWARFPREDIERQVIVRSWIEPAHERHNRWSSLWRLAKASGWFDRDPTTAVEGSLRRALPVQCAGLDVAASDKGKGDRSCLAVGGREGIRGIRTCAFANTQSTVAWVLDTMRAVFEVDVTLGGFPIAIDYGGGYGNAVGDVLMELGVKVVPVRGNDAPNTPRLYGNKRAELYGQLAYRLSPLGEFAGRPYAIPPDEELVGDLTAPEKVFVGNDGLRYRLTPKDRKGSDDNYKGKTIRERLKRSPDKGDAVVLCYEACWSIPIDVEEAMEAGFFGGKEEISEYEWTDM